MAYITWHGTLKKNYLNNRKHNCHFKGTLSTLLQIKKAVPQGSILGPLLLSIYINDFINALNKFQFVLYADHTTLFSTYDTFKNSDDDSMDVIKNKHYLRVNTYSSLAKKQHTSHKHK